MFVRLAPKAAVAALFLALLTACGDASAAQPAASPTPQGQERQYRIQAIIADCMKQKGFRYIPYVPPPREKTPEELKRESGDYAVLKEFREKYGFGVWYTLVYPQEFERPQEKRPHDPNLDITSSLSSTQRQAYLDANDACFAKAMKEVTGKTVASTFDMINQIDERTAQVKARELDGDPQLVDLATQKASCLKDKGYQVQSTAPSALGDHGEQRNRAELNRIAQEKAPEVKDTLKRIKNAIVVPSMTADEARPYLAREIKEALADLEYGKDFYPAYAPKARAVERQVRVEYGLEG